MTKPPIQKISQDDYLKSSLRLPRKLHKEIMASAERNGRSMNAEILSRLQSGPADAILIELAKLRAMVQQLIDRD